MCRTIQRMLKIKQILEFYRAVVTKTLTCGSEKCNETAKERKEI